MISILLILLMTSPAWAFPPVMMGKTASAAAAPTAFCTNSTSCPGNDCSLLCEDFEGSTNCVTGSYPYCRSTWTTTGTFTTQTWNYSTSPAPIQGSLSYYGDSGGGATRITKTIADSTTVHGFVAFVAGTMSTALYGTDNIVKLLHGSTAQAAFGYAQTAAGVYKWSAACGGAAAVSSSFTFSTGTVYYLKLYYKQGTGADAECQMDVYSDKGLTTQVATTGLKNTGTSAEPHVDTVELFTTNTTLDQTIYDTLKLHTSAIGGQSW